MSKLRLLDLFCGAGGAGEGYRRAGFDVVGVDLHPQKHYPFEFHQGDALEYLREHGREFDAIHASPPCQAHCALKTMHNAKQHADLIPATRDALQSSGKPWVIENVVGAPLRNPFMLCGTMFGLGVEDSELRRHRMFETSFNYFSRIMLCAHRARRVIGVYGGHGRDRRRVTTIGVYGGGHGASLHRHSKGQKCFTADQERTAMGIPWMSVDELSQAIPPAYTEFIGRELMKYLKAGA